MDKELEETKEEMQSFIDELGAEAGIPAWLEHRKKMLVKEHAKIDSFGSVVINIIIFVVALSIGIAIGQGLGYHQAKAEIKESASDHHH